jgi:hypothetical protein
MMTIIIVKHFAGRQIIYNSTKYNQTETLMQIYSYFVSIKTFWK